MWKPAILHTSKVQQEFQRLAAYLNGAALAGGTVSGVLSVLGTWYAEATVDTNNNGDSNVTVVPNAATIYAEGEAFVDDSPFEVTSAGVIMVTFYAIVEADVAASAPFTSGGMNCSVASPAAWPVNYTFVVSVAPNLADGQNSHFVITTPPLLVEAGANLQMNPFLNSGDAADKFTVTADSYIHVVKLA